MLSKALSVCSKLSATCKCAATASVLSIRSDRRLSIKKMHKDVHHVAAGDELFASVSDSNSQFFNPTIVFDTNNCGANGSGFLLAQDRHTLDLNQLNQADRQHLSAEDMLTAMGVDLSIDWNDWKSVKDEFAKVLSFYIDDFINEIAFEMNDAIIRSEMLSRIEYMLSVTNCNGKNIRGIITISSFFYLKKFVSQQQQANLKDSIQDSTNNKMFKQSFGACGGLYNKYGVTAIDLVNVLTMACVIEVLQSCALVLDDIMDNSITRRGQPCWYRQPNVGLKAINDGKLIQLFADWLMHYRLMDLDRNTVFPCGNESADGAVGADEGSEGRHARPARNVNISDVLRQMVHKIKVATTLGQSIDLELLDSNEYCNDPSKLKRHYTMERYTSLVAFKTSFYTFYMPYASALYLAGFTNNHNVSTSASATVSESEGGSVGKNLFDIVNKLSVELGLLFQSQDDYLDCFGNTKITGKIGTDIQDGKCTWLMVQALKLCSTEELNNVICKNYGKDDKHYSNKIKELYKQLNIPNLFDTHQANLNDKIMGLIESVQKQIPSQMFLDVLQKINDRKS